jgi:hypothetical protein
VELNLHTVTRFLRHIRAAWLYCRTFRYTDILPDHGWNNEDARKLSGLMQSPTGTKLRLLLNNRAAQTAHRACLKRDEDTRGVAAGTFGTIAFIDSLISPSQGASDETEQSDQGDELLVSLSP